MRKIVNGSQIRLAVCLLFLGSFAYSATNSSMWTFKKSFAVAKFSGVQFRKGTKDIVYGLTRPDIKHNEYNTSFEMVDSDTHRVTHLVGPSDSIANPRLSPDGHWLAYLKNINGIKNIWLFDLKTTSTFELTHFMQSVVSVKWSPDSRHMAFVKRKAPSAEEAQAIAENYHVIKVGSPSYMQLWSVDLVNPHKPKIKKLLNDSFSVSTLLGDRAYSWSPDSQKVVLSYQKSDGLDQFAFSKLAIINVNSGHVVRILRHLGWAYLPLFSPDGNQIAFICSQSSFRWWFEWHLGVVNSDGSHFHMLANTKDTDPWLVGWSRNGKSVYYLEQNHVTLSLNEMPLNAKKPKFVFGDPLNLGVPGINNIRFMYDHFAIDHEKRNFVFVGQSWHSPPELYQAKLKPHTKPIMLTHVNNHFKTLPLGKTVLINFKSADKTTIEALLTYPLHYRKGQRYPLVLLIHGGPNFADTNLFLAEVPNYSIPLASQQGYFVLRVNYRGSTGKGLAFRRALVGQLGKIDLIDLNKGVDDVIGKGLVDPEKLSVMGHSNGGSLTAMMVTHTNRYRSAVMIDGNSNYISLLGTNNYPQAFAYLGANFFKGNMNLFIDTSPVFSAWRVTTPVLIQGSADDKNVPPGQLFEFYNALKRNDKTVMMLSYPNTTHDDFSPVRYLYYIKSTQDWINKYGS